MIGRRSAGRLAWLALVAGTAQAGPHEYAWPSDEMPVPYRLHEHCPESLGPGTCEASAHGAFAAYSEVVCSHLAYEHVESEDPQLDLSYPGVTVQFSGDFEPGVVLVTMVLSSGQVEPGLSRVASAWIAFNDDVGFTTDARIAAGECVDGEYNLDDLLVRHVGIASGRFSPMLAPWCEPSLGVTGDLADEVRALYGPRFAIVCNPAVDGPVALPFTARCTVASRNHLPELTALRWSFSDGGTAEGLSIEHTFVDPGVHTVSVAVEGEAADCPEWSAEVPAVALVRACEAPRPGFTLERTGELVWQVRNLTPVDPYGCLTDLLWQVFAGSRVDGTPLATLESRHWEPEFHLPGPGRYTVVAHAAGIGGEGAARLTFNASGGGRVGCQ